MRTFTFDLVSVEKMSFITSTLVTTICIYTAVLTAAIVGLAFIDVCKRKTRDKVILFKCTKRVEKLSCMTT